MQEEDVVKPNPDEIELLAKHLLDNHQPHCQECEDLRFGKR